MKLLAIGRPRANIDARSAIAHHAQTELRALWSLYAEGFVRELYSPGGPGAVLVIEADSLEVADQKLAELPLAANQIIDFELIELRPFAALRPLFSETET
ncbi:MAG: hypothetical protein JO168_22545 [Solirubrobacterales bacterium]|nr:hypothetical protein [Solirubrobacterales bacterium]